MVNAYNSLEEYIAKLLKRIHIYQPHQLSAETISEKLGITILYTPFPSMRVGKVISLDSHADKQEQWQSFSHELCHVLWHFGSQLDMPMSWEVYQEYKADNFAQHFCIPSFMLDQMKFSEYDRDPVLRLQETFGVEYDFAKKRLHQYIMNLQYS